MGIMVISSRTAPGPTRRSGDGRADGAVRRRRRVLGLDGRRDRDALHERLRRKGRRAPGGRRESELQGEVPPVRGSSSLAFPQKG